MIRLIVQAIVTCSLIAGAVGCKKKEGESGSSAKTADPPAAPKGTGIPECDSYVKAMEKFTTCDKLPPEQRTAYASSLDRERRSFSEASDKAAIATQCTEAMKGLVEGAKFRNCPLE